MKRVDVVLLTDGRSDRVLEYPIYWLLSKLMPDNLVEITTANFANLPKPPTTLLDRLVSVLAGDKVDLVVIHRDAENMSPDKRTAEINSAFARINLNCSFQFPELRQNEHYCTVVPVRMTEAWFLFDAHAIAKAAGRERFSETLEESLPELKTLETIPNPKQRLHELYQIASGKTGRRLKKLNTASALHKIAEQITDFSPLESLPAFQQFSNDLMEFVATWGKRDG